jgi:hypothetical protein
MEKQMWDVSALLARANNLPSGAQRELQSATGSGEATDGGTPRK